MVSTLQIPTQKYKRTTWHLEQPPTPTPCPLSSPLQALLVTPTHTSSPGFATNLPIQITVRPLLRPRHIPPLPSNPPRLLLQTRLQNPLLPDHGPRLLAPRRPEIRHPAPRRRRPQRPPAQPASRIHTCRGRWRQHGNDAEAVHG